MTHKEISDCISSLISTDTVPHPKQEALIGQLNGRQRLTWGQSLSQVMGCLPVWGQSEIRKPEPRKLKMVPLHRKARRPQDEKHSASGNGEKSRSLCKYLRTIFPASTLSLFCFIFIFARLKLLHVIRLI